jgi:hypothetical protein
MNKKIFKTNLGTEKNKYVIFKTNIKKRKHIYENDHFSYVYEKIFITNLVFFVVHEFVLNISFLLLFTKLFTSIQDKFLNNKKKSKFVMNFFMNITEMIIFIYMFSFSYLSWILHICFLFLLSPDLSWLLLFFCS